MAVDISKTRSDARKQYDGRQGDDKEVVQVVFVLPFLAGHADDKVNAQKDKDLRRVNEGGFLCREMQDGGRCDEVQIFFFTRIEITEHGIQQQDPGKPGKRLVAHVTPVVKHVRRNDHQEPGDDRTPFAEITAPGPDHPDGCDAEQNGGDAGSEI